MTVSGFKINFQSSRRLCGLNVTILSFRSDDLFLLSPAITFMYDTKATEHDIRNRM